MKNENIDEIKFTIKLNDLQNFQLFKSKAFHIRGNPWIIRLERLNAMTAIDSLSVFLHSRIGNISTDWTIIAYFKVKLLSKFDEKVCSAEFGPSAFHPQRRNWGRNIFIRWKELMDQENGFIEDDECKIEIKVRASPLQNLKTDEWMKFNSIDKCCDKGSEGIFRLSAMHFNEFTGICSPNFILKDLPWRLSLAKKKNKSTIQSDYDLQIKLYTTSCDTTWSHRVMMACKLMSFIPNVQPIESDTKHQVFDSKSKCLTIEVIKWNRLIDFIHNNSFILEVILKIGNSEGLKINQRKCRTCDKCNDVKRLMCPICFGDLNDLQISALLCGHIFCTVCIGDSLRRKKICPTCNRTASADQLRMVYLP